MLKLIIEDDEGRKTVVPFVRDEITIGRQEGNTIRLTERNVSRRHARLLRQNGHVLVEDLGSYNGIRLNGEKIAEPSQVKSGDLIQIGDYDLAIQEEAQSQPPGPPVVTPSSPSSPSIPAAASNGHPPSGPHAIAHAHAPAAQLADVEGHEDTLRSHRKPTMQVVPEELPPPAHAGGDRDARRQSTAVIRIDQLEASSKRPVEELDASDAPRLVVMNTELAGREYACIRTQLHLGRTEDNDIQIDHRSMSRNHAKLVQDDHGEWKVVDLQSANGIRINGEQYGQAALSSGDVLELGHVKLKFLAAGERYVPSRDGSGKKGSGLFLGAAVIAVLLLAATGVWVLTRPDAPPQQLAVAEPPAPQRAPEPAPVAAPPTSAQQGTTDSAAAVAEQEAAAAAAKAAALTAEKAAKAREQMAARDFDGALETLDTLQHPDGTYPEEISDLVDDAQSESNARNNLEQAEQALESGKLDEALALLGQAQDTTAFSREYDRLKSRTDAAVLREARKSRPAPRPAAANKTADAQKHLEEGIAMLKKRQFTQARDSLTRCLKADRQMARCHMYLGSAYAKLRDIDAAARHYRAFVDMAPQDPFAPKISEFLRDHDSQRR